MRIWLYGRSCADIRAMEARCLGAGDRLAGVSVQDGGAAFPLGGLARPMQAAIRGELDQLLLSDEALLGGAPGKIREMEELFRAYDVSVKSASRCGKSSSW